MLKSIAYFLAAGVCLLESRYRGGGESKRGNLKNRVKITK
jgi:hypothetical protein